MQDEEHGDAPAPPPRSRYACQDEAYSTAVPAGEEDHLQTNVEFEALQGQVADLVLQKENQRLERDRLRHRIEMLERHVVERGSEALASSSSSLKSSSPTRTVHSAGRRRFSEAHLSNIDAQSCGGEDDASLVAALQVDRLSQQNAALLAVIKELEQASSEMQNTFDEKLLEAHDEKKALEDKLKALAHDRDALKERVADDVLLKSQRNRIEVAARRIAAPRVARIAGLQRLEAAEKNALAAHDEQYYLRRDLASQVPLHDVTLVFQMFSGADMLEMQSPDMVSFLYGVYRATLDSVAQKRGGYAISHWDAFTCYAFRSPTAALAFASACHVELQYLSWPDTILYCTPFAAEYTAVSSSHHPGSSSGGNTVGTNTLSFRGPRLHSYLHRCTPFHCFDNATGRLFYFGPEINAAISCLAYHVRRGEIVANEEWAAAVQQEGSAVPALASALASPVSPTATITTQIVTELLASADYDVEVRINLPRVAMVTATEPVRKSLYAQVPPPLPVALSVSSLWSILPKQLKHRRSVWKSDDPSRLITTEKLMTFLLLANRCVNGRAHSKAFITSDMQKWIEDSVQVSQVLCTRPSWDVSQPAAAAVAASPLTPSTSIVNATQRSPRKSLQEGQQGSVVAAAATHSRPHATSIVGEPTTDREIKTRRASTRSSTTIVNPAPLEPPTNPSSGTPPPSSLTLTPYSTAVVPALTLPFAPLLDTASRGSTSAITARECKSYFKARVFEKQAQAHESQNMQREDAFLYTKDNPISITSPPNSFVTIDVANVKTFDSFQDVLFTQFIAAYHAVVRAQAELYHAFEIATNGEDVFVFAFRDISDAVRFVAALHLRFREQALLDILIPESTAVAVGHTTSMKLSPSSVHLRCGITYGTPKWVTSSQRSAGDDGKRNASTCGGYVVAHSGYLCAAALPGEALVSQRAMKEFLSFRKNVISLDFTILNRGFRQYRGSTACTVCVHSLLPSKIGLGGRTAGTSNSKINRSLSLHRTQSTASPSSASAPVTQQPSFTLLPPPLSSPQIVMSGVFDASTASPLVSPPSQVEFTVSIDFDKIANVCNSRRRALLEELRRSPIAQLHLQQARSCRRRLELMERTEMASHDALNNSSESVAPSASRPLAVMYTDVEGSSKLLEAAGESFVRCQQHYNYIVKDVISRHRGFATRTNSYESWIVVFSKVQDAIEAAISIHQQLMSTDWPTDIIKQEKALRVRDSRSNTLLFNGLRARVGIAVGVLSAQLLGGGAQRVDYNGPALLESIRMGRSASGGDIWISADVYHELELEANADAGVPQAQLRDAARFHQLIFRPITDAIGTQIAVGCVLKSCEGRVARFPPPHDRFQRISSQLEKEIGCWWKNPISLGNRNESIKLQQARKKSVAQLGGGGGGIDGRSPSILGLSSGGTFSTLVERLAALDPTLQLVTTLNSVAQPPPPTAAKGTAAPSSNSPRSFTAAQQASDMLTVNSAAQQLSAIVRGLTALLQASSPALTSLSNNSALQSTLEPLIRQVEDTCKQLQLSSVGQKKTGAAADAPAASGTTTGAGTTSLKPNAPPPRQTNAPRSRAPK